MGPNELRQKAEQCRRLARQPFQRRSSRGGGAYLLELATKFEREAAQLETRMAGNKPSHAESRPAEAAHSTVDPGPLVGVPHKD